MRMISKKVSEFGTKRLMLVENPQEAKFAGAIVCFMYRGDDDGVPETAQLFYGETVDGIIDYLVENCDASPNWSAIPDQIPGCLDEWIAPVRVARSQDGSVLHGTLERLEGETWMKFKATT